MTSASPSTEQHQPSLTYEVAQLFPYQGAWTEWEGRIREPDVMVMLNEHHNRIQNQCWGPPDLAVEVLSPGTRETDRTEKLVEYAQAGVHEYWIVDPHFPNQRAVSSRHYSPDLSAARDLPERRSAYGKGAA